jgi:hypothetical protein
MTRRVTALIMAVASVITAGCGAADDEPFTDCAIGELTGTWRIHYDETDGNCGPMPDETGIFDPSSEMPAECSVQAKAISADKCRADLSWTCPTTDGKGTQKWVMVVRQRAATKLTGTATVQLDHSSLGSCRSSYAVTATQL